MANDISVEPEAMRYGFDGFGYKYIDSGSGSDWRTRHPDAEPLYASQPTQSDALKMAASALLADVRRRYPNEDLRCEYMIALDAALGQSK